MHHCLILQFSVVKNKPQIGIDWFVVTFCVSRFKSFQVRWFGDFHQATFEGKSFCPMTLQHDV